MRKVVRPLSLPQGKLSRYYRMPGWKETLRNERLQGRNHEFEPLITHYFFHLHSHQHKQYCMKKSLNVYTLKSKLKGGFMTQIVDLSLKTSRKNRRFYDTNHKKLCFFTANHRFVKDLSLKTLQKK
jgi:hypothetical protein